jgi:hypothetical protein
LTVTGDATGFDGAIVGAGVFVGAGIVLVVTTVMTVAVFCVWIVGITGAVTTAEVITGETFSFDSPVHPATKPDATSKTIIRRYFIPSLFICLTINSPELCDYLRSDRPLAL